MGFFRKLFGGSGKEAGDAVKGTLQGVGDFARDMRTTFTGKLDPEVAAQFEQKMAELDQQLLMGQMKINEVEAGNTSLFVAGWRPFLGWVGGIGFAFQFVLRPLLMWGYQFVTQEPLGLPSLDLSELGTILVGMLGLAGYRTVEKSRGVQNKH